MSSLISDEARVFIARHRLENASKAAEEILKKLREQFRVELDVGVFYDPDEWGGGGHGTLVFRYRVADLPYREILKMWSGLSIEFASHLTKDEQKMTSLAMDTMRKE